MCAEQIFAAPPFSQICFRLPRGTRQSMGSKCSPECIKRATSINVQEGTGSVRLGSVRFRTFSKINGFVSVWFGKLDFPVRHGSACVFRTRRGSVRFASVRFCFRFRSVPKLHGSVRFASLRFSRFDSVSYSFLFLWRKRRDCHTRHLDS